MDFQDIIWADSDVENINIEYDKATLMIWNDALGRRLKIECTGLAGITNLCIWDDTIISSANMYPVKARDDDFVLNLYSAYSENTDYGGRFLNQGLIELRIELINHIAFSIYCQKIDVIEYETKTRQGAVQRPDDN